MADFEDNEKLRIGDGFGNFSEINDKPYKPKWVVAVTAPLMCLKIKNQSMVDILTQSATK